MPVSTIDRLHIDLGVLSAEPAEEYHAKAGEYLSSHQLIDFMACPWLYRKKQLGLIPDLRKGDTAALLVGRATHCRILEGRDAYEAQFAVGGPINDRTGRPFGKETKAFKEWADAQGKSGVHYDDAELIENMASGVTMNDEAVDLLLYGRSEGVVRATYCDTPCQVRLDWVHPHRGIVDLKTTADLTWFENECKRRRYANQLAFYQAVLAEVTDVLAPCFFVAVEKVEPYRAGTWRLDEALLADCRRENEAAIARMKQCQRMDCWPTGYEQQRVLLL